MLVPIALCNPARRAATALILCRMSSFREWLESHAKVLASLAAVLALVGGLYAGGEKLFGLFSRADDTQAATPTPSASATSASPSPSPSPSPTGITDESPEDGDRTQEPSVEDGTGIYYLADVSPRATEKEGRPGRCTGGCTGFTSGAAKIGASLFSRSYLMEVASDGRRSVAVWSLARACTELSVTVGISDNTQTSGVVMFSVSLDGKSLGQAKTGVAEPRKLQLDVTNAATLELAAAAQSADDDGPIDIVWGDAMVRCAAGALGPA